VLGRSNLHGKRKDLRKSIWSPTVEAEMSWLVLSPEGIQVVEGPCNITIEELEGTSLHTGEAWMPKAVVGSSSTSECICKSGNDLVEQIGVM
jgi:hypothetical protein